MSDLHQIHDLRAMRLRHAEAEAERAWACQKAAEGTQRASADALEAGQIRASAPLTALCGPGRALGEPLAAWTLAAVVGKQARLRARTRDLARIAEAATVDTKAAVAATEAAVSELQMRRARHARLDALIDERSDAATRERANCEARILDETALVRRAIKGARP
ncbi:MAG: hypothetical protein AAFQ51_06000 [Pseudomonadota bacterium]